MSSCFLPSKAGLGPGHKAQPCSSKDSSLILARWSTLPQPRPPVLTPLPHKALASPQGSELLSESRAQGAGP